MTDVTIGNSIPTFFSCFSTTTTTTTTTQRNNHYYYNYIKNKLQLQKFIITTYVYNIKHNHNIMYVYCIACQQLCYSNCIRRVLSFVDACDLCLSILLNHK